MRRISGLTSSLSPAEFFTFSLVFLLSNFACAKLIKPVGGINS
jgi:hypothetical protein